MAANELPGRMKNHVYKLIELTGTSTTSIEDAVDQAVKLAHKTIRNMCWFQVIPVRLASTGWVTSEHWRIMRSNAGLITSSENCIPRPIADPGAYPVKAQKLEQTAHCAATRLQPLNQRISTCWFRDQNRMSTPSFEPLQHL